MEFFSKKLIKTFIGSALALIVFLSPLSSQQLLGGSSFLRSLGNIIEMVQEADKILWLLGNPAA